MRKILSILVSFAFVLITQMPFVHAIDMEMGIVSAMEMTSEHDGNLCSSDNAGNTENCYNEIPESKWVNSVREIELPSFFIAILAVLVIPLLLPYARVFRTYLKRRIFYNPTLYLGLYGITRNVN